MINNALMQVRNHYPTKLSSSRNMKEPLTLRNGIEQACKKEIKAKTCHICKHYGIEILGALNFPEGELRHRFIQANKHVVPGIVKL